MAAAFAQYTVGLWQADKDSCMYATQQLATYSSSYCTPKTVKGPDASLIKQVIGPTCIV